MRVKQSGITLLELMVVVAVVAILAAIAYPSFTDGLRKSRRAEGLKGLLTMQLKLEEYRISHSDYNTTAATLGISDTDYYIFQNPSGANATIYTLIATTKGAQIGDKAGSTPCDTLQLNKADQKTPSDCWK